MYRSSTQVRVRYGETDQMGFLYYGNYALYYEVGRVESIRQLGLSYKALEALGVHMPVVSLEAQYLRPALYDDLITVQTTINELPVESSIQFHTELFNENNKLLNKAVTTLVFYDPIAKRKTTMPEALLQLLQPFFIKKPTDKP